MSLSPSFLYLIAGMTGAILGSFANVCILRMPRAESVVRPPSHCPACGRRLSWWENIPILSFIVLRGRCRTCKAGISFRYPLVESLCVLLSLATWRHFSCPLPYLVYFCLFVTPLVIVSFIDLDHRIIPDSISIPGIFIGVGVSVLFAGKGNYGGAAIDSIAGALIGGVALFLVAFAYEKLKKQEGMGGGDIKLIAMLGAFLGWKSSIFILLLSSILGSVVGLVLMAVLRKDLKLAIPFGPFLAIAGLIQLFFGQRLIMWYVGLFR